jgi:hypothetical protein
MIKGKSFFVALYNFSINIWGAFRAACLAGIFISSFIPSPGLFCEPELYRKFSNKEK